MKEFIDRKILEFSKIIKELRLQNGLTQRQVAIKLEISYQSYQAYELGITLPTFQNFLKIANLYNVSLDYLVGDNLY